MLPGLCKFAARETAERQVRNPATGEAMTKPAGRAVKVTVVKGLKDALKG
jgi:DNA-binding protein HU-beta